MGNYLSRLVHSSTISRAARVAACLVLAVMSVEVAPPIAAATAPAKAATTQAAPVVAQPSQAATPATKISMAPTEVTSLRTQYSDTYDNHDGTFTASVSSGPINYRPTATSAWTPIDLTFAPIANGNGRVRAAKTPTPVEVGGPSDAAGFMSLDTGKGVISLSLAPGATPGLAGALPSSAANVASVSGLMPGMALEVVADTTGETTFLVLTQKPATSSFTFALNSPGLTPTLGSDGTITFSDKSGTAIATMPAPYANDATGLDGLTFDVSYSLSTSGAKTLLTVNVDPTYLANAIYPVYVDPSVSTISGTASMKDTFVDSYVPNSNLEDWLDTTDGNVRAMAAGTDPDNSSETCKDLLSFTLPAGVMGTTIDSATLDVFPYWQYYHTGGVGTWVDRVTQPWTASKVTWNNQPAITTTNSYNHKMTQGTMGTLNITAITQGWASGSYPNYGVQLNENGNSYTYWKKFYTSEHGGADVPALVITYHTSDVTAVAPAGGAWTSSRILDWNFADPRGMTQTQFSIEVDNNSDFSSPILSTGTVSGANTSYAIPGTTALTNGTTYYWEVEGYNSAAWSSWVSGSFRWDGAAPTWNGFTAPSAQVDQSASTYGFAWNAATGGGAAMAGYTVQLQSAPIGATPNTCGASWTNLGTPVTVTAATYSATSLATASCYRVGVSAADTAGNVGSVNYSNAVLVDSSAPAAPVVVDDTTPITNTYATGYTIYFRPSGPRTITLTSTGSDSVSDIASSSFGALSAPTGWTYTPGTVSGNSASKTIAWTSTAGQTTLAVTTTNKAGLVSGATTLTFVPLTGATGDFTSPDEGTTTILAPSTALSVAWVETAGTGGITARSLQRQVQAADSNGLCAGSSWTNDGSPTTSVSPLSVPGGTLAADSCYRWILTLTDSTGSSNFTSGSVEIDAGAPAASIGYPEAGRPLSGTVTVTGIASDKHLASYALAYGAGSAPSSWTTFAVSPASVPSSGPLGLWGTNSLAAGLYTLRLTATDFAGNPSVSTALVYIDNAERGDDAYNTKVPYDLGGGWALGVNVATGEASLERNLFSIPSYGPGQALTLSYNSGLTSTAGQFGTGWSSNLTQYLDLANASAGFVVWHRADGGSVPFGSINGTWTALAGHYEMLAPVSGGGYLITETDQSTLSFDATGRLSAISDRFGSSLTLAWSTSSATATDASGRMTNITIDSANHRITAVTDSAGRTWGFSYTSSNLTGVTDPASKTTTLGYTSGVLTSVSRGRTPAVGSTQTIVWSLAYNGAGQATSVTDPIGGAVTPVASSAFSYAAGTTTVRVLRDASNPGAPVFNTSTYLYDSHGWVSWASDPDGWATKTAYDANGNVLTSSRQVTSSTWATTTKTYDAAGNVLTSKDPLGAETDYTYNSTNDPLTETDAKGTAYAFTTAYVYDGAGHLCRKVENPTASQSTIGCSGAIDGDTGAPDVDLDTGYTYTANNQIASETDALGVVTTYGYDTYGDRTSVTANYVAGQADDSTSITTTWAYNSTTAGKAGLPTSETDPITTLPPAVSRTTSYTYEPVFGNVLTATMPGDSYVPSAETVNSYDEFGNALTTAQYSPSNSSDALSTTTTVYDARNRGTSGTTTSVTGTTTTTTVYDVAGDALTVTKPDGTSTVSTYDGLGQVLTDQPAGQDATTTTYDGLGDPTTTLAPAPGDTTTTTTDVYDLDGQRTSETTDATGAPATTSYGIDLLGRETSETDVTTGLVTVSCYDGAGRVTRTVSGSQITSGACADPLVAGATYTDTTYDRDGRTLTTTAPYVAGATPVVARSTYDNLGRVTSSIANYIYGSQDSGANLTTLSAYNAAGETIASLDPTGADTRTSYDIAGGAAQTIANCTDTDPGSDPGSDWASCAGTGVHDGTWNVTTTASDSASQSSLTTTSTSVVAGVTTTKTYDGAGRLLSSVIDPGSSPHLNLETDYAYDGAGRQIAVRDPAGYVTVTSYDAQGRVVGTIVNCTDSDPGALEGAGWAGCSGSGAQDGTWNQITSTDYDDAGNKTSETAPDGMITHYSYDDDGNMTAEIGNWVPEGTDPTMNVTTTYYYDADGDQIAKASPTDSGSYAITRDFYDSQGELTSEIANCTSSGTTPDANPATCTGAGTKNAQTNITTSYTYDAAGNKTSETDPSPANAASGTGSVTTDYAYDANNNLCRVLENATISLQDLDDPCAESLSGRATETTTQNVDTTYVYDAAGNMTSQTTSGNADTSTPAGTTTWTYDGAGNLVSTTDPDGNVAGASQATIAAHTITYTYDAAGQKIGETDPDTPAGAGPTISYAYDAAGRECRRVAASPGVVLQSLADPCTTSVAGATIDTRYTYDADGNQTGATDAIGGLSITSAYDALGRPTSVSGDKSGEPATTYTYDFTNPVRTDPSGTYTFTIDAYGREIALADPLHTSGHMYAWTYAPSGDVATANDPTGNTTTNTYDPLGRLTARSTTGASGCSNCAVFAFTYNDAGSELTRTSTISGDPANGTTTFSYDALSRLSAYTPPSAIAPQSYAYNSEPDRASITTGTAAPLIITSDAAGLPVSDSSGGTYASDGEGRITVIPGKSFAYDALGRLTSVKNSSGTVLSSYTYDPLDRLRTITNGSVVTRFRYVGTTDAVAQIVNDATGAVITNEATDLAGTELFDFTPGGSSQTYLGRNDHDDVTWTASTTGAVTARASYDPYGNLVSSSGTIPASRWQGSYFDTAANSYYVNARWYKPSLGTFLSEDPLSHAATDPQDRDLYAYGAGDPVDQIDPSGESACSTGDELACYPYPSQLRVTFFSQTWYSSPLTDQLSWHGSCSDTIKTGGCLVTSIAMVLNYMGVKIPSNGSKLSANPRSLVAWLNTQKTSTGKQINLINPTSCGLAWSSRILGSRLHVKVKQIRRGWVVNWYSASYGRNSWVSTVAKKLRHGVPVIAEVYWGNGHTHFVVITGYTEFKKTSGSKYWASNLEYAGKTYDKSTKTTTGQFGDFVLNDPSALAGGTSLFATIVQAPHEKKSHYAISRLFVIDRV